MYLAIRLGALLHVAAAAECYSLAVARGVSPKLVYDLIAGAAGSSAQFKQVYPKMMDKDFESNTSLKIEHLSTAMEDLVGSLAPKLNVANYVKAIGQERSPAY